MEAAGPFFTVKLPGRRSDEHSGALMRQDTCEGDQERPSVSALPHSDSDNSRSALATTSNF